MKSDPYALLDPVPSFELTSTSFADGATFSVHQRNAGLGGQDLSPQLSWSGFPPGTRSFAVTMFDPDAPRAGGYWHWAALNLPASTAELAEGAATAAGSPGMPAGTVTLKNDGGFAGFMGAAPPRGHGPHRYMLVVHALDVATLDIGAGATPAVLESKLKFHALARARLTGIYER
ncbi:YbhB/YbcL family Raf kinase inhibitor-like protein [Pseudarthrobacter sp. P1]|uniref:YbhB/YbcL family Raf kinase inhibitor-like protein n=1 Tax=Pseudarthrobacter sp. P1 TaxID=3418418 RepID=UPI003CF12590